MVQPSDNTKKSTGRKPKPDWLRRSLPTGPEYEQIRRLIREHCLHTVCQEAKCPNQFECFGKGTATFMILGDRCTRNCSFCAVGQVSEGSESTDRVPDPGEPERVAEAVALLKLRYAVVTSVSRDDLADGGASLFAQTIRAVRRRSPNTLVEVLIPDLQANWEALEEILAAGPNVLNHNVETVQRLYPLVRPQADYRRSLELLNQVKLRYPDIPTKSGLMLGLGESREEIEATWRDLLAVRCDILTMGQYLQPSATHLDVERFLPPEEFAELEQKALSLGFGGVASGPFVRSSYQAEQLFDKAKKAIAEKVAAA